MKLLRSILIIIVLLGILAVVVFLSGKRAEAPVITQPVASSTQ